MSLFRTFLSTAITLFIIAIPSQAKAGEIIRIAPDESKILRLEKDAVSVIVANPAHANILIDTPRLLVIVPHQPGSTSFTALDANGDVVIESNIVVTGASAGHIRVRRSCAAGDDTCQSESIYFCPDGCYNVNVAGSESSAAPSGSSSADAAASDVGLTPPPETGGE